MATDLITDTFASLHAPALANNVSLLDQLDSSAFAILTGQAGGQTLYGGVAANEDLTLQGTKHATKATSYIIMQPTGGQVVIGATAATAFLDVRGATLDSMQSVMAVGATNTAAALMKFIVRVRADAANPLILFRTDASAGTDPAFGFAVGGDTPVLAVGSASLTLADTVSLVLGTATGTKIGTSASQKLGFFNATPVVQQAELTDELTTLTYTAAGTPDYALQDLVDTGGFGFKTKDEGNTVLAVIANLQARVNELETRLVAYGLLPDAD